MCLIKKICKQAFTVVHVLLFPILYTSVLPRMYPRACGFGSILSVVSNMSVRSYTPISDVPRVKLQKMKSKDSGSVVL